MGEAIITRRACRSLPNTPIAAGSITFTTSQIWTAPFTGYIDIFLVNGGNGGGSGVYARGYTGESAASANVYGCRGGASGKCKTISQVKIYEGNTYEVIVGAGGQGAPEMKDYVYPSQSGATWEVVATVAHTGGTSSFGNWSNTPQYSGGQPAPSQLATDAYEGGGSDGGGGGHLNFVVGSGIVEHTNATNGTNAGTAFNQGLVWYGGSGGSGGTGIRVYLASTDISNSTGGSAGGGAGGTKATSLSELGAGGNGTPNTGGGGGGGGILGFSYYQEGGYNTYFGGCGWAAGGNGGSGVVIIKWNDDGQPT